MIVFSLLYPALCGCIFSMYYYVVSMPENQTGTIAGMNFNLVSYASMLILTYALFFVLIVILKKARTASVLERAGKELRKLVWADWMMTVVLTATAVAFIIKIYANENYIYPLWSANKYIRQQVNKPIYALFCGSFFVVFVLLAKSSTCSRSGVRILFGAAIAFVCAALVFAPNPFLDDEVSLWHTHAYVNSIINIARLKPFDSFNLSIYGHYGLLYLPLVKILGNNYTAVAASISVYTFAAYFCSFCICEKVIRNDLVYIITVSAISAVTVMIYMTGQYYQVIPQRIFFPAVSLLSITKMQEKQGRTHTKYVVEGILGSLSMIWNIETGAVCVITFMMFDLLTTVNRKENLWAAVFRCLTLAIVCVMLSYLTINVYSLLAGAENWMSFERYVYPIGSKTYSIDDLRARLPTPYSIFILQLMIFSLALLNASVHIKDSHSESYVHSRILVACIAVSGLGTLTYYVNLPAYANISISCMQMTMIAGIIGNEGVEKLRKNEFGSGNAGGRFITAGKLAMLLCVFIFSLEAIMSIGGALNCRIGTGWNMEELYRILEYGENYIPENTVGMGRGVPELFFQLGRDPHCVLTDWSDMNDENLEKAYDLLSKHDGFFFLNLGDFKERERFKELSREHLEILAEKKIGECHYVLCQSVLRAE